MNAQLPPHLAIIKAALDNPYSENDTLHHAIERMETYGGSFARAIAKAYYHADVHNRRKLIKAFQDLIAPYIEDQLTIKGE